MSQVDLQSASGPSAPRVFLSYAWESDAHRDWVRDLALRLRLDGVEVLLDRWELVPGDSLPEFMERCVRESDFVLVVCTDGYKAKSDARHGGVGYEGSLMTAEVATRIARRKFIPILRGERWEHSAPSWLLGTLYVDLRGDSLNEANYRDLLDTLHRRREQAPALGQPSIGALRREFETDVVPSAQPPSDARQAWALLRLLRNSPVNTELRREAVQWLSLNPDSPDFPEVLTTVLNAGGDSRDLLRLGNDWLATHPDDPSWPHVWIPLMGLHKTDEDLREYGGWQLRRHGKMMPAYDEEDAAEEHAAEPVIAPERDTLFRRAAELCIRNQTGSVAFLQRHLEIGFGRTARIVDQLQLAGVLGAPRGTSHSREVLMGFEELERICGQ